MSVFDSCAPAATSSPADYMEREILRTTRFKKTLDRKKIDVMGAAMERAMHDIKEVAGF